MRPRRMVADVQAHLQTLDGPAMTAAEIRIWLAMSSSACRALLQHLPPTLVLFPFFPRIIIQPHSRPLTPSPHSPPSSLQEPVHPTASEQLALLRAAAAGREVDQTGPLPQARHRCLEPLNPAEKRPCRRRIESTAATFSHLLIFSHLLTSSHLHIFSHLLTSSHLHIFSSSHIFSHLLTSSHILHLLIFTYSHIFSHLLTSYIFSSSHILTSSHIFSHLTSSHLHIFSHLLTSSHLTSSHLHIFSHLLTSLHLFIFSSSHILSSSHIFSLLPSCPLALYSLLLFYFSLKARGSANEAPRNATLSHETTFNRQKLR